MAALVTAAGDSSDRDYALVLLLGPNRLRVSELVVHDVHDVDDVDTERGHRVVRMSAKRATVPLAPQAFLPVLFLLAVVVSGRAVLPHAPASEIYLTSLGALLAVVYMTGLLFRPAKQYAPHGHRQHRRPAPVNRRSRRARRAPELNAPHNSLKAGQAPPHGSTA